MRLLVYDMLVNVNGIYYVHVCEQARWARSAGNSAIENLCIIIIIIIINVSVIHNIWSSFIDFQPVRRACKLNAFQTLAQKWQNINNPSI